MPWVFGIPQRSASQTEHTFLPSRQEALAGAAAVRAEVVRPQVLHRHRGAARPRAQLAAQLRPLHLQAQQLHRLRAPCDALFQQDACVDHLHRASAVLQIVTGKPIKQSAECSGEPAKMKGEG